MEGDCTRGTGCGHDNDHIWTSTSCEPEPELEPEPEPEPAPSIINAIDGCNNHVAGNAASFQTHESPTFVSFPDGGGIDVGGASQARSGYLRYGFECSKSSIVSWTCLQYQPIVAIAQTYFIRHHLYELILD